MDVLEGRPTPFRHSPRLRIPAKAGIHVHARHQPQLTEFISPNYNALISLPATSIAINFLLDAVTELQGRQTK